MSSSTKHFSPVLFVLAPPVNSSIILSTVAPLHLALTFMLFHSPQTISFFSPPSEGDHQLYPGGYVEAKSSAKPLGVEIALTAPDVVKAHKRALDAGAKELSAPADKPWGQKVSYVRCPDGTVVELCSPMQCTSC